jgi:putative intracellular protease/amidase
MVNQRYNEIELYGCIRALKGNRIVLAAVDRPVVGEKTNVRLDNVWKLSEVTGEFDALAVISGLPDSTRALAENNIAMELARRIYRSGGYMCGLCQSGLLFAYAGLVKGVSLTSYPSNNTAGEFTDRGAKWLFNRVVVDGQFITSQTMYDVHIWAKTIGEALEGKIPSDSSVFVVRRGQDVS